MPIVQESLLLAHIHPKPDVQAADEGGNDSSDPESQSSSDIASDDEDDQLTRLLQVWANKNSKMDSELRRSLKKQSITAMHVNNNACTHANKIKMKPCTFKETSWQRDLVANKSWQGFKDYCVIQLNHRTIILLL